MGLVPGIVVFVIIWWLVLFMVLPWGVRTAEEPEKGHAESAPVNPRIWTKFGITTLITAVLWGAAYWVISAELITFRQG